MLRIFRYWQTMMFLMRKHQNTKELDYLKYTASIYGYTLDVIGVNQDFHYLNKIKWLNAYFNQKISIDPGEAYGDDDDIIIFTDAYDTFFVDKCVGL